MRILELETVYCLTAAQLTTFTDGLIFTLFSFFVIPVVVWLLSDDQIEILSYLFSKTGDAEVRECLQMLHCRVSTNFVARCSSRQYNNVTIVYKLLDVIEEQDEHITATSLKCVKLDILFRSYVVSTTSPCVRCVKPSKGRRLGTIVQGVADQVKNVWHFGRGTK